MELTWGTTNDTGQQSLSILYIRLDTAFPPYTRQEPCCDHRSRLFSRWLSPRSGRFERQDPSLFFAFWRIQDLQLGLPYRQNYKHSLVTVWNESRVWIIGYKRLHLECGEANEEYCDKERSCERGERSSVPR